MAFKLLGPSLEDLLAFCDSRFSLKKLDYIRQPYTPSLETDLTNRIFAAFAEDESNPSLLLPTGPEAVQLLSRSAQSCSATYSAVQPGSRSCSAVQLLSWQLHLRLEVSNYRLCWKTTSHNSGLRQPRHCIFWLDTPTSMATHAWLI